MPQYSIINDRLFLLSCSLYVMNRWIVKPNTSLPFFHHHLNDLLCFPIWIPFLVALLGFLHLRTKGEPPDSYEILIPLVLWSWMFEGWFPTTRLFESVTIADHRDIIWYAAGALVGAIYWRWWEWFRLAASAT